MPRPKKKAVLEPKAKIGADLETSTRVCFVIDKTLYKDLRIASIERGLTVSEVLRQASVEFSQRMKAEKQAS